MAKTLASQAKDGGSIPLARSGRVMRPIPLGDCAPTGPRPIIPGMDERVAHLHTAVDTLLELVDRYAELVDAAHAAGLHPALLAGIDAAEARADVPGLRAALGVTVG